MLLLGKRHKVIFAQKEELSYRFLKTKLIAPSTQIVEYTKDNLHPIDISRPTFKKRLTKYYIIDVNAEVVIERDKKGNPILDENSMSKIHKAYGGQLSFKDGNLGYNPHVLGLLKAKTIKEMITPLKTQAKLSGMVIMLVIFGVLMGVGLGWIARGFF